MEQLQNKQRRIFKPNNYAAPNFSFRRKFIRGPTWY